MGFTLLEAEINAEWYPVDGTGTVYEGSIVTWVAGTSGVTAIGNASGASNTTNKYVPLGIVIGTNDWKTQSSTPYGATIVGMNTAAAQNARDWRGVEGSMYPKNDPAPMVLVAWLNPYSMIKGPIFNSTYGTAPSVTTAASGLSTTGFTNSATCGFTPVAYNATHLWRTGANSGISRVGSDTSTTVHTVVKAFPNTIVAGDTCVSVNLRPGTNCYAQIDATGTFLDTSAALTANYYIIDVKYLDLSVAGSEYAVFRFNQDNFTAARA